MTSETDLEQSGDDLSYLHNTTISRYSWRNLNCTVGKDNGQKSLLSGVSGTAQAGQLLALMGPSGSGKTTLLNQLAQRGPGGSKIHSSGDLRVDGQYVAGKSFTSLAAYVEQEDALIGSLTAKETLKFSSMMAPIGPTSGSTRERVGDRLLAAFGMTARADTIVGTPIKKGLSGGQKRRLSVAAQLITGPKLLFLDEPTSGLDSTASREVMWFIKQVAVKYNLIVIVSIHQPSTATFNLFDSLCLLSAGRMCYFGPVQQVQPYLGDIGFPLPVQTNPADYLLDLVNDDFKAVDDGDGGAQKLAVINKAWRESHLCKLLDNDLNSEINKRQSVNSISAGNPRAALPVLLSALIQRAWVKSYRDITVYAVRIAMYIGLAILMGTVWLRLGDDQDAIQAYINALFFGGAFLSFMNVAYVPAYLEDYAVLAKDRANGLYGPVLFVFVNLLIGLPYLVVISVMFTVITYWLTGFRNSADAVLTFIMWLLLDLEASDSMVVLLSSLLPNGVIALVLVAFANGLWMAVNGFLVPLTILNDFYRYVLHYIDYQAVVFTGMMRNEFTGRTYGCASDCSCMFASRGLQCRIPGESVLDAYGINSPSLGENAAIVMGIIVVFRMLTCAVLWRKRA